MGEANRKAEVRAETLRTVDKVSITLSMDFEEMQDFVARAMALALYRARLPWLPGEKISADDLRKPATFLMGVLAGGEAALAKAKEN